jgi:diguanylate cyclase (GGDEF)-like protein/PAS domain S-box-containing protein
MGRTIPDIQRYRLQAQRLLAGAPMANAALLVGVILVMLVMQSLGGGTHTLIWATLLMALALARLIVWRHYRSAKSNTHSHRHYLFVYGGLTAIMGLAWASVYFLMPPASEPAVIALLVVYFGVTVGAYSLLTPHFPSYAAYILPSTLVLIFSFLNSNDTTHQLLGITVALIGLVMLLMGRQSHQNLLKMALLEDNNRHLISKLQNALTRKEMEVARKTRRLATSEEQLRLVIEGAKLGFWDWQYQSGEHAVNDRWLEMLGLSREDIRNDVSDWSDHIHPEDKERVIGVVENAIQNHSAYRVDFRMRHKDGHWVWIQGSGAVVEYDDQGQPLRLCGIHQEISDRKRLEAELQHRASHDALTGLLNRTRLWELLDSEIGRARRYRHDLSLMMLDLDHFKPINDTFGHQVGDTVLKHFSEVLQRTVRHSDFCLRYGGEEFVVIMPETGIEPAKELAERIRHATESCRVPGNTEEMHCTVSIGIASFPTHGETPARLIETADAALYQAKGQGRNRVLVAAPEINAGS